TARLYAAAAPTRPQRAGDPGAETGLSPALTATVALERPLVLGGAQPRLASPSLAKFEPHHRRPQNTSLTTPAAYAATGAPTTAGRAIPIPIPEAPVEAVERVRQHPYVPLALNRYVIALWRTRRD